MAKYHYIGCHVLWREACYFAAVSDNTLMLTFLEQGLHVTPDLLRERLQSAIDQVQDDCSAVLVGYGLCSNGIEGIRARNVPLVVPRAHDCITFLLGSKERYRKVFDEHPGTYWYSPGWIDTDTQPGKARYEATLQHYTEKYGEDNAEYLMETMEGWIEKYDTAAYVDLGFHDSKRYVRYTQECAEYLGWQYKEFYGDPGLLEGLIAGRWDERQFLIVPPEHFVAASHDDRILTAKCESAPVSQAAG